VNISRGTRRAASALLAVALGFGIATLDARSGWDDTGITAGLLALAGAASTLVLGGPRGAVGWLLASGAAVLVGIWIPLLEIAPAGDLAPLASLLFAAVGAAVGHLIARTIARREANPTVH
jgi:hypothetical protein